MKIKIVILVFVGLFFFSCSKEGEGPDPLEEMFKALSQSNIESAEKVKKEAQGKLTECEFRYVSIFIDLQKLLKDLENAMKPMEMGAYKSSSLIKMGYDLMPYVYNVLRPFEQKLMSIRENSLYAYENSCTLYTPFGVNFSLKFPSPYASFSINLGYEWDEGEARIFYALSEFVLSLFDFVLSHSLEVDVYAFPNITGENGVEMLRSAGALLAWNSELLDFSDSASFRARFDSIAERWLRAFLSLNDSGSKFESIEDDDGVISFLFSDFLTDSDPSDDVLSIVDEIPLGRFSPGDKIIIGLRSAELGGVISIPSMEKGIILTLDPDLAQVFDSLYRAVSSLFWKIEQSLSSVYDDKTPPQRITVGDINKIIASFTPVAQVPELPEIAEIDLKAFFRGPAPDYSSGPKPLRDYLPYWYDDDGNHQTDEVFLVEGECLFESSPHVFSRDWEHFPDFIQFQGKSVQTKISADRIGPEDGVPITGDIIYYLGLQDPSFNGTLYLNLSKLPFEPEQGGTGFLPADLYTFNKLLAYIQIGAPGINIMEALPAP